jgi:hypothetical protein
MPRVFQDTVFAALVRAVLGPTYFPHIDEKSPACVYQRTIHLPKASSATLGTCICDRDDPFNVHGRDHAVDEKPETGASDSEDLESSRELSKPVKEEGKPVDEGSDSMLVTWYGPDDPEVCQDCRSFHTKLNSFL